MNIGYLNTAMKVCVNNIENELSGMVYSCRVEEPFKFENLGDLLLKTEDVFERQNFPQAFMKTRSFVEVKPAQREEWNSKKYMALEDVEKAKGKIFTLILKVNTRKNASWQGVIEFDNKEAPIEFKSALEAISLINTHALKLISVKALRA